MADVSLALLAADTDRTQAYVFESARLPEIRGASWKLDDLNRRIARKVKAALKEAPHPLCQVVYAGGGGLLAIVPESQAEGLARAIEALYPQETGAATITADWRPITRQMLQEGYPRDVEAPFGALVRWAGTWLRQRKESKTYVPFVPALPHVERCASCRQRPADPSTVNSVQGPLCEICGIKREVGGRDLAGRDYWFAEVREVVGDRKAEVPRTLGEIGQASRARPGYVGFIYLDGDGLGQWLERLPTAGAYSAFSAAVESAARSAVFEALRALPPVEVAGDAEVRDGESGPVTIHPFEILTIGGDDVMLIVPADQAIPIACAISLGFERAMRAQLAAADVPEEIQKATYTLSGGVVLAVARNPVRFLRDLAEQLRDSAKAARKEVEAAQSYLDFVVLTSSDMAEQDIQLLRQGYPYTLDGPPRLRLSMRPYPATALQALWDGLGNLHQVGFPNSQMGQLSEALLRGRREATLYYLYQLGREKAQGKQPNRELDQLLRKLHDPDDAKDPLPWVKLEGEEHDYATALWDIAELFSFAGARREYDRD